MTRADIERDYRVSERGTILSLGKFEAEMLYAPYFYNLGCEGGADEDIAGIWFFQVSAEDRAQFPELADVYGIALEESDTGFVRTEAYSEAADYDAAIARIESVGDEG